MTLGVPYQFAGPWLGWSICLWSRFQEDGWGNGLCCSSDVVTEVFALAALDSHPNVLRYFSSWIENGHLYIQSEYCDGKK